MLRILVAITAILIEKKSQNPSHILWFLDVSRFGWTLVALEQLIDDLPVSAIITGRSANFVSKCSRRADVYLCRRLAMRGDCRLQSALDNVGTRVDVWIEGTNASGDIHFFLG